MHTKPGMFDTIGEAVRVTAIWAVATAFCLGFWALVIKAVLAAFTQGRASW